MTINHIRDTITDVRTVHRYTLGGRAGLCLALVLADTIMTFGFVEMSQRGAGNAGRSESLSYTSIGVIGLVSAVSWVFLPFALHHDRREFDPHRRYPGPWYALAAGLMYCATAFVNPLRPSLIAVVLSLCARRSARLALAALATCALSALPRIALDDVFITPGLGTGPSLVLGAAVAAGCALAGAARGRARQRRSAVLFEAHRSRAEVEQLQRRARQEERDNIARDMHDSLSHRLSLISVYAGALKINDGLDRATVRGTAGTIQQEAEAAVQELREVLRALRSDPDSDPRTGIGELAAAARAAGTDVEIRYETDGARQALAGLTPLRAHTVTHFVQEGLTNARKHAPSETIEIVVRGAGGSVEVALSNRSAGGGASTSGYGLIGLAERARLVGGELRVDAQPGRFTVQLKLPAGEGVNRS